MLGECNLLVFSTKLRLERPRGSHPPPPPAPAKVAKHSLRATVDWYNRIDKCLGHQKSPSFQLFCSRRPHLRMSEVGTFFWPVRYIHASEMDVWYSKLQVRLTCGHFMQLLTQCYALSPMLMRTLGSLDMKEENSKALFKGTNPPLKKSSNIPEIYAKMFGRFHWLCL